MMIKHVKIRSYCMVPQIQGPTSNITAVYKMMSLGTKLMNLT
jgi:hypothetical protein